MFVAQLNGDGICVAVTEGLLVGPQFVRLASFDISVLGKKWTGTNWIVI